MRTQIPRYVIRGEQKTTGKRFFIAIRPTPESVPVTYYKVPHDRFATVLTLEKARAHCWVLSNDYPGNTYAPVLATYKNPTPTTKTK